MAKNNRKEHRTRNSKIYPIIFKLMKPGLRLVRPFLPLLKNYFDLYKQTMLDTHYLTWAKQNEELCLVDRPIRFKPLISVVVPVYDPEPQDFKEMVEAVINQHYENWELVIVNASTSENSRLQVSLSTKIDTRIKVVDIKNRGISGNTNEGIKKATGEYIAFLDHDDTLHPCALHSVVEALQSLSPPQLLYTDEDKINQDGTYYFEPLCKPDWSPDLFRNVNYINHFVVIKKKLIDEVSGLRTACDGAQDYDLLLRIIDKCRPDIKHIPRILYHWRAAKNSTASAISTKDYIFSAGEKAIGDHIKRNKIAATVKYIKNRPGFYEVVYKPVKFSVIVGPVDEAKRYVSAGWIKEILKMIPHDGELILEEWYKDIIKGPDNKNKKIQFVSEKQNYWLNAARQASNEVVICFKVAGLPKNKESLEQLASVAADKSHSAVSPIIVGDDNTILDSGIVSTSNFPKKLFEGIKLGKGSYFGSTEWVRNVSDLTTNIIAVRTELLASILEESKYNYSSVSTFLGLIEDNSVHNFLVWTHTPFIYKGVLKLFDRSTHHNIQFFRFSPTVTMHVDNWGEEYKKSDT